SRAENDLTVLSIFVNPTQFGPGEDFRVYPRDKKRDVLLAKKENVDIMFYPSAEEMYPRRYLTYVEVREVTRNLCGQFRSGHFTGVATVVVKLLNIVRPHTLYLGQKDAQQCVVIKQMIRDLNFPIDVRIMPIIREKDGLALSSRNKYLNTQERQQAAILYRALNRGREMILKEGERQSRRIKAELRRFIRKAPLGRIEYIECVDADTLEPLERLSGRALIALAVKFGKAKLIDNMVIRIK
ncbi:MAG: pantoate--beta-alanine ligase, partial [Candidatus Omnitrophota bacterium]